MANLEKHFSFSSLQYKYPYNIIPPTLWHHALLCAYMVIMLLLGMLSLPPASRFWYEIYTSFWERAFTQLVRHKFMLYSLLDAKLSAALKACRPWSYRSIADSRFRIISLYYKTYLLPFIYVYISRISCLLKYTRRHMHTCKDKWL